MATKYTPDVIAKMGEELMRIGVAGEVHGVKVISELPDADKMKTHTRYVVGKKNVPGVLEIDTSLNKR